MKNTLYLVSATMLVAVIGFIGFRHSFSEVSASVKGISKTEKINHKISLAKVRSVCERLNGPYVLLEMYPIKHSPDETKKDFDVVVFYRDMHGPYLNKEEWMKAGEFRQKAGNYFSYLKKRKIDISQVPLGYETYISAKEFCKLTLLESSIYPNTMKMVMRSDTCRIPPGCNMNQVQTMSLTTSTPTYDSCRIPPGCAAPLLNNSMMKELLEAHFYSKKN